MKKFKPSKRVLAIVIVVALCLSGIISVVGVSAAMSDRTYSGASVYVDELGATIDEADSSRKHPKNGDAVYEIKGSASYGLKWTKTGWNFTNVVTGESKTYPSNWKSIEYESAYNTETKKSKAVWCVQPGVVIDSNKTDYFDAEKSGSSTFWNKLKNKPELKNAIAQTIAYGKAKGGTKKSSPYYYAVNLLVWDFIMGHRNTSSPYEIIKGQRNNLLNIEGSHYKEVQNAANQLVSLMKNENEPLDSLKKVETSNTKKSKKLFKSKETAFNRIKDGYYNVRLKKRDNYYVGTSFFSFPELKSKQGLSLSVVNDEGKTPSSDKNFNVSFDNNSKIVVETTANLDKLLDDGWSYYVKLTLNPQGYTEGTDNCVYQSESGNNQTLLNLKYTAPTTYAYLPIYYEEGPTPPPNPEYCSLTVEKSVISSGNDYQEDPSGWNFLVYNNTKGKLEQILTTNSDGKTATIENIPIKTEMRVTEIGKKIGTELPSNFKESDWYNVKQWYGTYYGFPVEYTDVTHNGETYDFTLEEPGLKTLEWRNIVKKRMDVVIKKNCTDGDPVSGYYFLVADFTNVSYPSDLLLTKPQIVGPTNAEGKASFKLDRSDLSTNRLAVIELGKLKSSSIYISSINTDWEEVKTNFDKIKSRFTIPGKYITEVNSEAETITGIKGITNTIFDGVTEDDYKALYETDNYQKEIEFTNTPTGKVKIHKTDEISGKDVGNAIYGIYQLGQNMSNKTDAYEEIESLRQELKKDPSVYDHIVDKTDDVTTNTDANDEFEGSLNDYKVISLLKTDKNGYACSDSMALGDYFLVELYSPSNYSVDTYTHDFTITKDNTTVETAAEVDVTDLPSNVVISKVEAGAKNNEGENIAGAHIEIYEKDNPTSTAPVLSFVTKTEPEQFIAKLDVGKTYILHETKAPNGYFVADDIEFTVKANDITNVTINEKTTEVHFKKVDITGTTEIEGATLTVSDTEGKVIEEWISSKKEHIIYKKLASGKTYFLKETIPAPGYVTANDVEFTVNNEGKPQSVTMKDEPTQIEVEKVNENNGKPLSGCVLVVEDEKSGKEIDKWTTTGKPHKIVGKLVVGSSYLLREIEPAPGFVKAKTKKFTVQDTANVQSVVMEDPLTQIHIEKVSAATNKPVPNCNLQVLDKATNKVIDSWSTDTKAHEITGKLVIGKTYILKETKPAPGYVSAPSVEFTVKDTEAVQKVTMKDPQTQIRLEKVSDETNLPIEDCDLQVIDKSTNKVVDSWITDAKPHDITGKLVVGNTYILKEIRPANKYVSAEQIEFTVKDTEAVQKVTMKDPVTKIEVEKIATNTKKPLANCSLQVVDKANNKVIDSWTSTNEAHKINGKLVVGKSYILKEAKPAPGYASAKSVEFTVKDTAETQKVTMQDGPTKVKFSKTDITGQKEIPGCELELKNSKDEVIEKWTSTEEPHLIEGKLTVGETYILTETRPADGYVSAESVSFTVKDTGEIQTAQMKDDVTKVNLSKTDITGEKEIPGCDLELKNSKDEIVEKWTSTDKPHYIEGQLIVGETYTLTETRPADGYVSAESVSFTVKDTGEIQTVQMKDEVTKVKFSKTDITGDKEIPGCELELKNSKDEVIEKWTSTEEPHLIEGKLTVGETYILTETRPANGYVTAESISFVVQDSNKIQSVQMKDDTTKVKISKTDITGEKEIPGCDLELKNSKDEVIEKWTSTEEPHLIEGKLIAGETYILTETRPADGYVTAESVSITVKDTGEIQAVTMKDDITKIDVSKVDITGGQEIPGCNLKITDEDGSVIEEWTSGNTPHRIEGLVAGKSYILTETRPADGYTTAESVKFTINDTGDVQKAVMKDAPTQVQIIKISEDTKKPLEGAELELKDSSGKVIDTWTSSSTPHSYVGKLIAGETYTLSEKKAPDGYEIAKSISFKLMDTDKLQKVTMVDKKTPIVTTEPTTTTTTVTTTRENPNLPKTGERSIPLYVFFIGGGLLVVGIILFFIRKRIKTKE